MSDVRLDEGTELSPELDTVADGDVCSLGRTFPSAYSSFVLGS